jgi:hypothetical protein
MFCFTINLLVFVETNVCQKSILNQLYVTEW